MLSEEITGLIVDLVTCDLCPDALVEEKGSKSLMKFNVLNLDIKFPQQHTLLNWFEKKKQLQQDCPTQWNSTYYMGQSLLENWWLMKLSPESSIIR